MALTHLTVDDPTTHIATLKLASAEDVGRMLAPGEHRGAWQWVTLANGEVCLATFPQYPLFEELLQKGTFS